MRIALFVISVVLFVATVVWPAVALVWYSVVEGVAPREGFAFSASQFALLGRTFFLAMAAAVLCIPPAVAAGVLAVKHRSSTVTVAFIVAGLLCPPMVYAFGWQRMIPPQIPPEIRCIVVWVLWAWPIGAMVIAGGWARVGREAYEAALLNTHPLSAWLRVGLPSIRAHILLALLLVFVLFFGDYGVPHAFGLRVYATELLAWASESNQIIDALWAALPSAAVTALALNLILGAFGRCGFSDNGSEPGSRASEIYRAVVVLLMAGAWGLPLIALCRPLMPSVFSQSLQTYGIDLLASAGVSLAAAGLIVFMTCGLSLARVPRRGLLFSALLLGALPGALVGQAFIAAYDRPALAWVYDHWPIVSIVYVARYAWIGLLACEIASRSRASEGAEQARVDGAREGQVFWHILVPQHAPLLLGVGAVVVALAVGDVAASTLVRVPGYNPIAHVIIEKFHRFEDGMLISLSLMLVGIAGLGSAIVAWTTAKFESRQ